MLVKSSDRAGAYRALLNTALKDKTIYCNNCGEKYNAESQPCCEEPQIGTNAIFARAVVAQNKIIRETRKNSFASTKDKVWRWGISVPPFIFELFNNYEKMYGRKFIRGKEDVAWFAKNFPPFAVPERI
jgi:hypothetical protein